MFSRAMPWIICVVSAASVSAVATVAFADTPTTVRAASTRPADDTDFQCPIRRTACPIIISGKNLLKLKGIRPEELVAFRYGKAWRQIPVQVDQRAVVDYRKIYGGKKLILKGKGFKNLVYTDPKTFTGADHDSAIDADDEVVFMADDAGQKPPQWKDPDGTVAGTGVQVEITDPLDKNRKGYVYLFRSRGVLKPSAGKEYVRYEFKLAAGDYRARYRLGHGPNPEDSTIATRFYTRHFSDRWISDGLTIKPPMGTGVDLLDMHKCLFAPGNPLRSVRTFSAGEGAFIVNKSGPVRAIRSYVGCNSGPLTQRRHFFYERREDIQTFLRVHSIGGIVNFFDYSEKAKGMRYFNNLNPKGVKVDGVTDRIRTGRLEWEMLKGEQGALILIHRLKTNIRGLRPGSYYLDDENPKTPQCTGDARAYAASGVWVRQRIANTDPTRPGAKRFNSRCILFFENKDASVETAKQRLAEVRKGLTIRLSAVGDRIKSSIIKPMRVE